MLHSKRCHSSTSFPVIPLLVSGISFHFVKVSSQHLFSRHSAAC
ncbi:hypothetical protein WANA34_1240 [Wolbachia endosymbiont of Drosophila ananassae]|nr:hypothetical protein WANA34_1240 [Wolbachia endosymbiont of Drosophila ananassae]